MEELDKAALILSDFFATTVIAKLHAGQKDLYVWERDALEWLRAYRADGGAGPINYWTASYLADGPPPWRGISASARSRSDSGNAS